MSTLYEDLAISAREILEELGTAVTLTKTTGDTPARLSTDTAVAGSNTTYTPYGVFLPYADRLIDGTRVQQGDRIAYLDNTIEPEMDDLISHNSQQWTIVDIKTYQPGTEPVVYQCRIRK